jgi:uncharacterized protein
MENSMIKRAILQPIIDRLKENRKFIQVIAGPRQTGKTTLVLQALKEPGILGYYVAADDIAGPGSVWIEQQWDKAHLMLKQQNAEKFVLVIDEIQKIPNWSETVKRLWDEDSRNQVPLQVVLSGSSRLLLKAGLTESMAGRFETLYIGHWPYKEMNEAFGWTPEQYAWYGGYPGPADLIIDESRWKRYIWDSLAETSISKDILMLSRVDKPALMRRLFDIGCSYSGQVLAFNKILGQLLDAGNTTTLSNYLSLLDSAGLLGGIEKFSMDKARKRSSSPKFQVHNTAFMGALDPLSFQEARMDTTKWGRIVESTVGAHLINNTYSGDYSLYYWRDGNYEVDFVLVYKGKVVALEVKSGYTERRAGMMRFRNLFPEAKVYLVGRQGISWEEFIMIDPIQLF